jgi:hypothetical protein
MERGKPGKQLIFNQTQITAENRFVPNSPALYILKIGFYILASRHDFISLQKMFKIAVQCIQSTTND